MMPFIWLLCLMFINLFFLCMFSKWDLKIQVFLLPALQHDAEEKKKSGAWELYSHLALHAIGVAASAAAAHFAFCSVIGRAPPAICIHVQTECASVAAIHLVRLCEWQGSDWVRLRRRVKRLRGKPSCQMAGRHNMLSKLGLVKQQQWIGLQVGWSVGQSVGRLVVAGCQFRHPATLQSTINWCKVSILFSSAKFQWDQLMSTNTSVFFSCFEKKIKKVLIWFPVLTGNVSQKAFNGRDSCKWGRVFFFFFNKQSHPQLLGSWSGATSIGFLLHRLVGKLKQMQLYWKKAVVEPPVRKWRENLDITDRYVDSSHTAAAQSCWTIFSSRVIPLLLQAAEAQVAELQPGL